MFESGVPRFVRVPAALFQSIRYARRCFASSSTGNCPESGEFPLSVTCAGMRRRILEAVCRHHPKVAHAPNPNVDDMVSFFKVYEFRAPPAGEKSLSIPYHAGVAYLGPCLQEPETSGGDHHDRNTSMLEMWRLHRRPSASIGSTRRMLRLS